MTDKTTTVSLVDLRRVMLVRRRLFEMSRVTAVPYTSMARCNIADVVVDDCGHVVVRQAGDVQRRPRLEHVERQMTLLVLDIDIGRRVLLTGERRS